MIRAILLLAVVLTAALAEEQRQLDPTKPADALVILDALTQDVAMPRRNAEAFRTALLTLARVVEEAAAAKATPPPVPAAKD